MRFAGRGLRPEHEGLTLNGKWTGEVRMLENRLTTPMGWASPRRIFVDSMSDLFHPSVPEHFLLDVLQTMAATPRHTYQVLTKRPQAMARFCRRLSWAFPPDSNVATGEPYLLGADPMGCPAIRVDLPGRWLEEPLPNVWWGTSIENAPYGFRADHLRRMPAAVRFLSLEPLLGPVLPGLDLSGIDWVIVGGESGPGARPMHPAWARDVRDLCDALGIAFHFKQWGEWAPYDDRQHRGDYAWVSEVNGAVVEDINAVRHGSHWQLMRRVGKKAAGRELDGRTHDDFPTPRPGTGHAA